MARLGPAAVATVGVTEALLTLIFAVALGLSLSTTATVARRIGEKDPQAAAVTAVQAVLLGALVAVPTGLVGILWPRELLGLMGLAPEVVETDWTYTAWMLGGNGTILLLFLINAIFRGAGDASVAMRSLWLANGVNIVLDPCLIFGLGPFPEMGITGAAIGTTAGRAVGVAYQLRALRARGADCLRIISYGYAAYAWGMVMVQAFNGAGDTVTPTWINLFCYWLLQIPLAWALASVLGLGPAGVYWAITIAETVIAVVAIVFFRRGTWKTRAV